ncbi:hypothetical protein EVAR_1004_1 [Eumeta japonica]|uniref:Uncharacterized protein n=1 Tax=Eumeta variegata TaxID=151549 RepID=A0A4C1SE86_EUMVA|nr:hypothetical protein EVAR_1004_1 [Eumeta japonica]
MPSRPGAVLVRYPTILPSFDPTKGTASRLNRTIATANCTSTCYSVSLPGSSSGHSAPEHPIHGSPSVTSVAFSQSDAIDHIARRKAASRDRHVRQPSRVRIPTLCDLPEICLPRISHCHKVLPPFLVEVRGSMPSTAWNEEQPNTSHGSSNLPVIRT